MKAGRIAWSIVVLLSVSAAARAGPVTFQFAGEVTRVSDPLNLLGGGVEVGSPFVGFYTFESTTSDSNPGPLQGIYDDAVTAVSGMAGSVPFSGPIAGRESYFRVDNGTGEFERDLYALQVGITLAGQALDFSVVLGGGQTSALFNDALPNSPPDIELFEFRGMDISDTHEIVQLQIVSTLNFDCPGAGNSRSTRVRCIFGCDDPIQEEAPGCH